MKLIDSIQQKVIDEMSSPFFTQEVALSMERASKMCEGLFERSKGSIDTIKYALDKTKPYMEMIQDMNIPEKLDSYRYLTDTTPVDDFFISQPDPIQDVYVVNTNDLNTNYNDNNFVEASYKLPQNATWESLSIEFLDGHFVRISYPNMETKKFDYKDMGFMDKKTTNPNRKWVLLRTIADNHGSLTSNNWDSRFPKNIKYELNKQLKRFFRMKENPIPNYTKKKGYEPLCTVIWVR